MEDKDSMKVSEPVGGAEKLNPPACLASGADGNQHSKDRQLLDTYQIFPQGINKI